MVLNASLIDVSERGEHTIRGMATNFCSLSEAIEEMASESSDSRRLRQAT